MLLGDRVHGTGGNGAAAFADGETLLLFHGDRGDQLDGDGDVVAGHDHFGAFGKRVLVMSQKHGFVNV